MSDLPSYDELMRNNKNVQSLPSYDELMAPKSTESTLGQDIGDTAKGLAQGATFGFGDEILGALQAARDKVGGSDEGLADSYRRHQQENENDWKEAKERSPYLTGAGEIAGSIASPVTGALGLTKGGLKLGQMMLRAGAGGALAGAGGSEGTIADPKEIGEDTLKGAALGAGTALGVGALGKLGKMATGAIEDSTLGQKLKYLYNKAKGGETFSGEKAGTRIQNEVFGNDEIPGIKGEVTQQFLKPLKDASKSYGAALDEASSNGAMLPKSESMDQAVEFAENAIGDRGGFDIRAKELMQKLKDSSLNPSEAKELQLLIRRMANKPAYQSTEALQDLQQELGKGIQASLPEDVYAGMNKTFSQSRQAVEPLINKGETSSLFQGKSISDIDSEQLAPKIGTYLEKLMSDLKEGNISGDEARASLQSIVGNIKKINQESGKQFLDPDSIEKLITEGGFKAGIRRGMVGTKTADKINITDSIGKAITGSPYKAMEMAGKAAGTIERTGIPAMGRNLYAAGDEQLSQVAGKIKSTPGLQHMGQALEDAIQSKNVAARNAALFTIMQNPKAREQIDFEKEEQKP